MKSTARWSGLAVVVGGALLVLSGCASGSKASVATAREPPSAPAEAVKATPPTLGELLNRDLPDDVALLIGAGDIADCSPASQKAKAEQTASIIKRFPSATVFTLGDNAYRNGTKVEFEDCYQGTWGGFKERTRPSPGNHDYGIYPPTNRFHANPYFEYFGSNAGPKGRGSYSYDLGKWHLVSLNSMVDQKDVKGAPTMVDQTKWLEKDLEGKEGTCVLAYWHHPLFTLGEHADDVPKDPGRSMGPLWKVLLDHRAEVVLNGHDHHYERFNRQDQNQLATSAGLQEFIVGTGGGDDRGLGKTNAYGLNSKIQIPHVYGVLLLTLHPKSYEWHFIDTDGNVRDWGSEECH